MLTLRSWPRAIAHVDADAFFASVEQALHPEYRGKPVITGAERGIVACASYEAKALGIKRAVPLHEVKRRFPQCIVLPSDYETYSLFSKRIFAILRRYSPDVEEYSIDEAFVDLTGLRRMHHMSYTRIAEQMKAQVATELGINVSIGLSLSKVLAKLGSKRNKPDGFCPIPGRDIEALLEQTKVEEVWGLGPNTCAALHKLGIYSALDYIRRPVSLIKQRFGKVGLEIYQELRGESVYALNPTEKTTYASISKFKTFAPASKDPSYVYARLLRNLESACIKARRYDLQAKQMIIILRTQDFSSRACKASLSRCSAMPMELQQTLKQLFKATYQPGTLYRATGVVLNKLDAKQGNQFDLFHQPLKTIKLEQLYESIDTINARYGKHSVYLSDGTVIHGAHSGRRGEAPERQRNHLPGETERQHLRIPQLNYVLK